MILQFIIKHDKSTRIIHHAVDRMKNNKQDAVSKLKMMHLLHTELNVQQLDINTLLYLKMLATCK